MNSSDAIVAPNPPATVTNWPSYGGARPRSRGRDGETFDDLPAPSIPVSDAYGGIGLIDIADDTRSIDVLAGPYRDMVAGDVFRLYWEKSDSTDPNPVPVAFYVVQQNDNGFVTLSVRSGDIKFVKGEVGTARVWYDVELVFSGDVIPSRGSTVVVKLTPPGGLDPDPITDMINENLAPPEVEFDLIGDDEAAQGVDVTISPWEHMSLGDRLQLTWGGVYLPIVTIGDPGEIGQDVVITVGRETIEHAGDAVNLTVTYWIRDVVNNWSLWAPPATVEVDIGITVFDPPTVVDAENGQLDLDNLGGRDVAVTVPPNNGMVVDDRVTLTWDGRTAEGTPVPPYQETQNVQGAADLAFTVPYAAAAAIAQGVATVSYTVEDPANADKGRSRRTVIDVIGTALELAPPEVVEAQDGTLDPDDTTNGAHVLVPPYTVMAPYDEITLYWKGTTATGVPKLYMEMKMVEGNMVGKPMEFIVPAEHIDILAGGNVEVYYRINTASVRALLESPHVHLNVAGEFALPPPEVDGIVDGVLDPADVPAGTRMRVQPYPGIEVGDVVRVYWDSSASGGAYENWLPVRDVAVPLEFTVSKEIIDANVNTYVTARYQVERDGMAPQPSRRLDFRVGETTNAKLARPEVDEADGNDVLDPSIVPGGATIRIAPYDGIVPGDWVYVEWGLGTGDGEFLTDKSVSGNDSVNGMTFTVPYANIAPHIGGEVIVMYRVDRADGSQAESEALVLTVGVDEGDLLPPPSVEEANGDQLDLPVPPGGITVVVASYDGMADKDVIHMTWARGTADEYTDFFPVNPNTVGRDIPFTVPAEYVTPFENQRVPVEYHVVPLAGEQRNSAVLRLKVGEVDEDGLPPPQIDEAVDGVLNPDHVPTGATFRVKAYEGMAAGDSVEIRWGLGTGAGEYTYTLPVSGGMVGKDLTRVVPHANILPHINGTVTLDYVLQRAAGGPPEPSIPLTLEVNRTAASLPKATVTEAVNDVLDPRDAPNGAEVVIAWHSLMQAGDTVVLEWQGAGEPGSDTQEKLLFGNDVGHPIRFTVPYAKVKPNDGTTVQVSYRVEHDDNVIADSEVLDLAVVQPALPAASVDEAANDLLNPDDMPGGATVRIPVAARLRAGDVVIIQWTGSEDDGTTTVSRTIRPEDVGRDLTETVALRYVQANVGGTVTLEYAIDRALTDDEESPPSVYDVRRELGSGDLLVMGARFNRSMYRASSAPRYLSALNRQTHAPLRAEWQYDGETNWTAGTTFRDTQPHLLLRVRSATDEGTINPANFIGTGSDSTTADLAAFVAHLDAGNVYGWGNATNGGDIPSTIITMDDIVEVTSTSSACSARRINHRVVAWGVADTGGSGVPNDMDAEAVVGNSAAMAARLTNGGVAAWGTADSGATVPPDIGALRDVKRIVAASSAFALIHGAGQISQVKAWGTAGAGGTVPPDIGTLTDIVDVCGNYTCFLALRGNGHVVAWGRAADGATVPGDVALRNDILEMCATARAFAVRTGDGHVMAWGNSANHGNTVPDDIKTLSDIVEISATWGAFCARRANGHVVAWGDPARGGDVPTDIALLDDIVQVTGTGRSFAATRRNGTVVAWGDPATGGNTTPVAAQLTDVRAVYANAEAFVALTTDRRVVAWGAAGGGGDNAEIGPLRNKISYQATPASRGHALRINRARAKAASAVVLETA